MNKILLLVVIAFIGTDAYGVTVATPLELRAENANLAELRSQTKALVSMVKAKQFENAEKLAIELRRAYETKFNVKLKQYTFQSQTEFDEFKKTSSELFEWIDWGYKECLQMLAFINVDRRDSSTALEILNDIEKIAPVSAGTTIETGYVLNQMGMFNEGLSAYRKAHDLSLRYSSQKPYRGAALRCMGYALIELKRIEEAERMFQESLKIDPMNKVALNELTYIQSLRSPK